MKFLHFFWERFFVCKQTQLFVYNFLGTGVCRRLVGGVGLTFQALPELWSPRVWFTFRNRKKFKKLREIDKLSRYFVEEVEGGVRGTILKLRGKFFFKFVVHK